MLSVPSLVMWLLATSMLSAELLNDHLKLTSGGFASTSQEMLAFSCFATPWTRVWFGLHVGASVIEYRYSSMQKQFEFKNGIRSSHKCYYFFF